MTATNLHFPARMWPDIVHAGSCHLFKVECANLTGLFETCNSGSDDDNCRSLDSKWHRTT